jgi:hypothetical protein
MQNKWIMNPGNSGDQNDPECFYRGSTLLTTT